MGRSGKGPKNNKQNLAPEKERFIQCCADITLELTSSLTSGTTREINLNGLITKYSKKYKLRQQPRLTDIINAIPDQYKKYLLPKLKAKPVRTASGIAVIAVMCKPHRCPHIAYTGNICVYLEPVMTLTSKRVVELNN